MFGALCELPTGWERASAEKEFSALLVVERQRSEQVRNSAPFSAILP